MEQVVQTRIYRSLSTETNLRTPLLARRWADLAFQAMAIAAIAASLGTLVILIGDIIVDGIARLNWIFFTSFPSRSAEKAGIASALVGSLGLILITIVVSLPLGVGAAVYLEEYAGKNRTTRLIELCIANLAGVPSVIYGLLGLQIFARLCGFDRSLLSGGLTLAVLILPIIIISSRESLRGVPKAYREGAIALGATKWQAIRSQVLPVAFPGLMTGCILAFSRALGETAPLVTMGALMYVAFLPDSLFSGFSALPIQTFNWLSRPQSSFHENAAAAIVVLLVVMFVLNGIAFYLRARFQKRQR